MSSEIIIIGDPTSHITHSVLALLSILNIPHTFKSAPKSPDYYHHRNISTKFFMPPTIIYMDHQYNDPVHFFKTLSHTFKEPSPWFPENKKIQSKIAFVLNSIHKTSRKGIQTLFKDVSKEIVFAITPNMTIESEAFFMSFSEDFLNTLDFNLKKTGFIAKTEQPTYADVFLYFEVSFLSQLKIKVILYPTVYNWMQTIGALEGVKDVIGKLRSIKGTPYHIIAHRKETLGPEVINKYRNLRENIDNYYCLVIDDFMILSGYEQEYFFYLMFTVFVSGMRSSHYEGFKQDLLTRKSQQKTVFLLFEKDFHNLVSFVFDSVDAFYFTPDNTSASNKYITSFSFGAVQPHFPQSTTFDKLFAYSRKYLSEKHKNSNILSYNTILSPVIYESLCKLSQLVYPKPNGSNHVLEPLLKKLMKNFNSVGETNANPFVVQRTIKIIGDEVPLYRKNYPTSSAEFKYFVDQTGLKDNHLLATVTVERLIQGNTLSLEAGEYLVYAEKIFEVKQYENLSSLSYKI